MVLLEASAPAVQPVPRGSQVPARGAIAGREKQVVTSLGFLLAG
jgi:hypothetical protein